MVTISLCMIVKNEENVLERCLQCVKNLVDEIIIVDTGSNDKTEQIALKYTDKVYPFQWIDNFAAARNYAFSKASMDYCMWLDADDIMLQKDSDDFMDLKSTLTLDTDIVMMRYNTSFNADGSPSFWYYRERLIRNNHRYFWQGAVHEVITPSGNIIYSDIAISHRKLDGGDPDRNLYIYNKMLAEGKVLNARELYYYGRELYYHKLYEDSINILNQFLSSQEAWIENRIEACIIMAKCSEERGDRPAQLQALLRSLEYDEPRAEVCCEIGKYFLESKQYQIAIFWYKTALSCTPDFKKGGFIIPDCYDYLPSIQLCVCYDRIGRYDEAIKYNNMAGEFMPDSEAFLYNKSYFDKKI